MNKKGCGKPYCFTQYAYMKFNKLSLIVLVGGLFVLLTSCRSAATPEQAGVLYVNQLIYADQDPRFSKTFKQGDQVVQSLDKKRDRLMKELVTNLSLGADVSQKQKEALGKTWYDSIQKKTSYEIDQVKVIKKKTDYQVFYQVKGLDFTQVYTETMNQLITEMLKDEKLAQDNQRLNALTMKLLTKELKQAPVKKESLKVSLRFKRVGKQWEMVEMSQNETDVANVLLAFMVGSNNVEHYTEEMSLAVKNSLEAAYQKVRGKELQPENQLSEEKSKESKKKEKKSDPQTKEEVETVETYEK
ncbi:hypothetical protein [Vagococcus humatus]|nr:hypothetical protein [Vagococcus humatus]